MHEEMPIFPLQVKEIRISKLFGIFNHSVFLDTNTKVTIIFGPNGVGKTVIFNLLLSLFKQQFSKLLNVPFTKLTISYSDGSILTVDQRSSSQNQAIETMDQLVFTMNGTTKKSHWTYNAKSSTPSSSSIQMMLEQSIPFISYLGGKTYRAESGEVITEDEVWDRYEEYIPIHRPLGLSAPEWLIHAVTAVPVRFIETQRLTTYKKGTRNSRDKEQVTPTVREIAQDLSSRIQKQLAEYAGASARLDRTFPQRLISFLQGQQGNTQVSHSTLQEALQKNDERRQKLLINGIIDSDIESYFVVPDTLGGETEHLLQLYTSDVSEKLEFFEDLLRRVELFRDILGKKLLLKDLHVNKEDGMFMLTKSGQKLALNALSSGEQHELVVLYDLLFRTDPGTLVLIDEPEISLHIAWQEQFLRDAIRIAEVASVQIVIATHSPNLIHDRWDLARELMIPEEEAESAHA